LNPGGFDYERWLFTEGVGATMSANQNRFYWDAIRPGAYCRLAAKHYRALVQHVGPQSCPDKALTIGDGAASRKINGGFVNRHTHLVVISVHVGLVAGWFILVLKFWAWTGF
jgi:competence protein ComEC